MSQTGKSDGPGKPFQPGNRIGKGRPAGSRNKATIALQELLDGEGAAITRKAIALARSGNEVALRLCLDRLIPPRRERPIRLELPDDVRTAKGVSMALEAILIAVSKGDITPQEGERLATVLEIRRKAIETEEFESCLTEIEAKTNNMVPRQ